MVVVSVIVGVAAALLYVSFAGSEPGSTAAAAQPPATSAHARIAAICMPPAGKGLRRIDQTDEEFRYQGALRSPAYFNCALILERERFCKSDEKAILVRELQTYFGHIVAKQQIIDTYMNDPNAKAMMKMAAAVEGKDGGISSRGQRPEPAPSVVVQLRSLVRDGYLRARDFGWSVPQEIEVHLKGVEKLQTPC